jgi:uncharacterized protein
MRIGKKEAALLKNAVQNILPDAGVYLFGSRVDDSKKGGDIDVLVIASRPLTELEKSRVKSEFYARFGEQKIDIVSLGRDEKSAFRDVVELTAVPL